jgi:hypothetical protein
LGRRTNDAASHPLYCVVEMNLSCIAFCESHCKVGIVDQLIFNKRYFCDNVDVPNWFKQLGRFEDSARRLFCTSSRFHYHKQLETNNSRHTSPLFLSHSILGRRHRCVYIRWNSNSFSSSWRCNFPHEPSENIVPIPDSSRRDLGFDFCVNDLSQTKVMCCIINFQQLQKLFQ